MRRARAPEREVIASLLALLSLSGGTIWLLLQGSPGPSQQDCLFPGLSLPLGTQKMRGHESTDQSGPRRLPARVCIPAPSPVRCCTSLSTPVKQGQMTAHSSRGRCQEKHSHVDENA